jgi:hypothetical protein
MAYNKVEPFRRPGFIAPQNLILNTLEISTMATNPPTGDGHRNGAVRDRSQVFNPVTRQWVKRNADTGRFMDVKKDGEPFKGVRKEN